MILESRNPATEETMDLFTVLEDEQLETILAKSIPAFQQWRGTALEQRQAWLYAIAAQLRERRSLLAGLISEEMGKLLRESLEEVDKCATLCEFYADKAPAMLADETVSPGRFVRFEPLGTVLAIMPWNFPFWQVFRFLVPTLMAGNTALLKHAPNVPQCAQAIESLIKAAGLPDGVFANLPISVEQTEQLIADQRIHGIAFTGSEAVGRRVAALAGQHLKKAVLELGGSDPVVVLNDADLDQAVAAALRSRYRNAGQTCIAAKRFILETGIADDFIAALKAGAEGLCFGDPLADGTAMAPMARADLRDKLQAQVDASVAMGAKPLLGCRLAEGPGFYYPASILDHVVPGMPAFDEEVFGPVAAIVRADHAEHALALANNSRYGLSASIWTADQYCADRFAGQIESGMCFINAQASSDFNMPFGGVKASGLGRELATYGIREFCNLKSITRN